MSPAKKLPNIKLSFLYPRPSSSGQGIVEIIVVIALAAILILALVALAVRSNRSANFSSAADQAARLSQEGMELIRNVRQHGGISTTAVDGGGICLDGTGNTPPCRTIEYSDNAHDGINSINAHQAAGKAGTTCFRNLGWSWTWNEFYTVNVDDENAAINSDPGCALYGRKGLIHESQAFCPTATAPGDSVCLHFTDDDSWHGPPGGCAGVFGNIPCNPISIGNRGFTRYVYVADTPPPNGKSQCNTATDYDQVKQWTVEVQWADTAGTHSQVTTECITRD